MLQFTIYEILLIVRIAALVSIVIQFKRASNQQDGDRIYYK